MHLGPQYVVCVVVLGWHVGGVRIERGTAENRTGANPFSNLAGTAVLHLAVANEDVANCTSPEDDRELLEPDSWGGVHASPQVEREDELRDLKLFHDVVHSIREWRERKRDRQIQAKFHRRKRDEEVVCYGDLGCFRDEGPFNYLDMLPSPPQEIGTVFLLFTRKNQEIPQVLAYNNITTVLESNFNVSLPTKVIIHGFGSSCAKVWTREMRLSFLAVEACNVICVDWAAGAVDPNYVRAAVNTRLVGKQVALLIKSINENIQVISNRTHLIGFSLGAHVSGFVGKETRNLSRITGLDPAGPLFEGYSPNVRLDKTDAEYVDVIHSNGDSLIIGGLGAWEPIGHVDFYPNGGRAQRGCQNLLIGGLYDFIYSYSSRNESYRYLCNHRRAYKLFTDSISPKCRFTAFPCDSYEKFETGQCFQCNSEVGECGQLGYYSNLAPGRGSLYLLTRDEEPFCANQFKIIVVFTGSRQPIYTYGEIQMKLITQEGINETFTLTSTPDELLTSGARLEKLIVAHPALVNLAEIQLLYIAYSGWIYTGRPGWSIDQLIIANGLGMKLSYCKDSGELLPSGIPVARKLHVGDCPHAQVDGYDKFRKGGAGLRPPMPNTTHPLPSGYKPAPTLPEAPALLPPELAPPPPPDLPAFSLPPNMEYDISLIPKPLLVPIEPQVTMVSLPGAPNSLTTANNNYNINTSIQKAQNWKNKLAAGRPAPLQPPLLAGPPGAWNVVTSRPGHLPPPIHIYSTPTQLSTVQPGAGKLPSAPPAPLPARRRPSSSYYPVGQNMDMLYAESGNSLSLALNGSGADHLLLPATERIDKLKEEDIIMVGPNSTTTTTTTTVKTDILSDNQLTIFKVGPDNNVEKVEDMTSFDNWEEDETKFKYVILHKLPNGEVVNLENLMTYSLADIESGASQDNFSFEEAGWPAASSQSLEENGVYYDVPRRLDSSQFIVYHPRDLDPERASGRETEERGASSLSPEDRGHEDRGGSSLSQEDKNVLRERVERVLSDTSPTNRTRSQYVVREIPPIQPSGRPPFSALEFQLGSGADSLPESSSLALDSSSEVQLLPPRLSAVLSQLRHGRQQLTAGRRQNKISPHFKESGRPGPEAGSQRMEYGRQLSPQQLSTQQLSTQQLTAREETDLLPVQTQLLQREDQSRYIPLVSSQAVSIPLGSLPVTLNSLADRRQLLPQQQLTAAAYWPAASSANPGPGAGNPAPAAKMFDSLQPPDSSTQAAPSGPAALLGPAQAAPSSPAAQGGPGAWPGPAAPNIPSFSYSHLLPLLPAKLIRHQLPSVTLQDYPIYIQNLTSRKSSEASDATPGNPEAATVSNIKPVSADPMGNIKPVSSDYVGSIKLVSIDPEGNIKPISADPLGNIKSISADYVGYIKPVSADPVGNIKPQSPDPVGNNKPVSAYHMGNIKPVLADHVGNFKPLTAEHVDIDKPTSVDHMTNHKAVSADPMGNKKSILTDHVDNLKTVSVNQTGNSKPVSAEQVDNIITGSADHVGLRVSNQYWQRAGRTEDQADGQAAMGFNISADKLSQDGGTAEATLTGEVISQQEGLPSSQLLELRAAPPLSAVQKARQVDTYSGQAEKASIANATSTQGRHRDWTGGLNSMDGGAIVPTETELESKLPAQRSVPGLPPQSRLQPPASLPGQAPAQPRTAAQSTHPVSPLT